MKIGSRMVHYCRSVKIFSVVFCMQLKKELDISFPRQGWLSNLVDKMLTHTQSLRSLRLCYPTSPLEDRFVTVASSGLKKHTTLRELTLEFPRARGATTASPIFTSLCDHPLLQRLCLRGYLVNLTGLETVLLSDNSKITELELDIFAVGPPIICFQPILQALARRPTLTKLALHGLSLGGDNARFGRDIARLLRIALCNIPSLQSLDLARNCLGSVELAEVAPALYRNTSIEVLDISGNHLNDMETAEILGYSSQQ